MRVEIAHYGRSEELVAAARVVFALLLLVLPLADPALAGSGTNALRIVVWLYLLVAVAVGFTVLRSAVVRFAFPLATHAADIATATALIALTENPVTPLFHLFTFVIFSATLRFAARGVWATGAAVAALYLVVGWIRGLAAGYPAAFVTRLLYLVAVTALLAYLRRELQRKHEGLLALATWPRGTFADRETLVRTCLEFAISVLRVKRAAAVFEESDEPWSWFASTDGTSFAMEREGPEAASVDDSVAGETFFCPSLGSTHTTSVVAARGRVRRIPGCPIPPELSERLGAGPVLSAPIAGREVTGRLYLLGHRHITIDDLSASKLAGELFATSLDEFTLLARERSAYVTEERLRVARDLHDTLLQSLTAMRLQLDTALALAPVDPDGSQQRIRAVQELITKEHSELRVMITSLRPGVPRTAPPPLTTRLGDLPLWCLQQWDIIVSMDITPANANVREPLATEIYSLVNEALANAAKHGQAERVRVEVAVSPDTVRIVVVDDGKGFPFHGTFDLRTLQREERGPKMLRERTAALGGELVLHSSAGATAVTMEIPVGDAAR